MTVRITEVVAEETTILHVEGRLESEDIRALDEVYQQLRGKVALELSQLRSADAAGISVIRALAGKGVELRGVSGFIGQLLTQNGRDA